MDRGGRTSSEPRRRKQAEAPRASRLGRAAQEPFEASETAPETRQTQDSQQARMRRFVTETAQSATSPPAVMRHEVGADALGSMEAPSMASTHPQHKPRGKSSSSRSARAQMKDSPRRTILSTDKASPASRGGSDGTSGAWEELWEGGYRAVVPPQVAGLRSHSPSALAGPGSQLSVIEPLPGRTADTGSSQLQSNRAEPAKKSREPTPPSRNFRTLQAPGEQNTPQLGAGSSPEPRGTRDPSRGRLGKVQVGAGDAADRDAAEAQVMPPASAIVEPHEPGQLLQKSRTLEKASVKAALATKSSKRLLAEGTYSSPMRHRPDATHSAPQEERGTAADHRTRLGPEGLASMPARSAVGLGMAGIHGGHIVVAQGHLGHTTDGRDGAATSHSRTGSNMDHMWAEEGSEEERGWAVQGKGEKAERVDDGDEECVVLQGQRHGSPHEVGSGHEAMQDGFRERSSTSNSAATAAAVGGALQLAASADRGIPEGLQRRQPRERALFPSNPTHSSTIPSGAFPKSSSTGEAGGGMACRSTVGKGALRAAGSEGRLESVLSQGLELWEESEGQEGREPEGHSGENREPGQGSSDRKQGGLAKAAAVAQPPTRQAGRGDEEMGRKEAAWQKALEKVQKLGEENERKQAAWQEALDKAQKLEEDTKQITEALVKRAVEEDSRGAPRASLARGGGLKTPKQMAKSGPVPPRARKAAQLMPAFPSSRSEGTRTPGRKKTKQKEGTSLKELSQEVSQLKDIVESKKNKRIALQFALLKSGIELPDFSDLDEERQLQELEAEVLWMQQEMRGMLTHLRSQQLQWIDRERMHEQASERSAGTGQATQQSREHEGAFNALLGLREQAGMLHAKMEHERQNNDQIEAALLSGHLEGVEAQGRPTVSRNSRAQGSFSTTALDGGPQDIGRQAGSAVPSGQPALGGARSGAGCSAPGSPQLAHLFNKAQTLTDRRRASGQTLQPLSIESADAEADPQSERTTPTMSGSGMARFNQSLMKAASELKSAMVQSREPKEPKEGKEESKGGLRRKGSSQKILGKSLFHRRTASRLSSLQGQQGDLGSGNVLNLFTHQRTRHHKAAKPDELSREECLVFSPRLDVEDLRHNPNRLAEEMLKCMLKLYAQHAEPVPAPSPREWAEPSQKDKGSGAGAGGCAVLSPSSDQTTDKEPYAPASSQRSGSSAGISRDSSLSEHEPSGGTPRGHQKAYTDLSTDGETDKERQETSDPNSDSGAPPAVRARTKSTPRAMLKQLSLKMHRESPRASAGGAHADKGGGAQSDLEGIGKMSSGWLQEKKGAADSKERTETKGEKKKKRKKKLGYAGDGAKSSPGGGHSSRRGKPSVNLSEELERALSAPAFIEQPIGQRSSSAPSSSSSAREWWGLEDYRSDPYGVLGTHPCPEAGTYTLLLDIRNAPPESITRKSPLMKRFRGLAAQLEDVDPSTLEHDQRLAFWINVHNCLLLHASIIRPTPANSSTARISLLHQVAFSVGGLAFSSLTMEFGILRHKSCKPPQAQYLPSLTLRDDDRRSACRLTQPEPLVSFALCHGAFSSPSVRVYVPETVHEQLYAAKVEFLAASVSVTRHDKIILPKLLDWYAKDFAADTWSLLEWVAHALPSEQAVALMNCMPMGTKVSPSQCVTVVPYNWHLRFLMPPLDSLG